MVIVVSAWCDDGRLRARVVHRSGGLHRTLTCGSVLDVVATVRSLLEAWERVHREPDA